MLNIIQLKINKEVSSHILHQILVTPHLKIGL